MTTTYVGGCRAQALGVHWGHIYGFFSEIHPRAGDTRVFVISDTVATSLEASGHSEEIARSIMSWPSSTGIIICRESRLRSALAPLTLEIERSARLTLLEKYHPHRKRVRESGGYRGTVGDFVFPVHQASYLLGLNTAVACYNDDNEFVVAFAREAGRLVAANAGVALPTIVRRDPPHLIGRNGTRMCKANGNILPLDASPDLVRRYVGAVVGRGVGLGNPDESRASSTENALASLVGILKELPTTARDRHADLTKALTERASVVAEAAKRLPSERVLDRLTSDEETAVALIEASLQRWFGKA